MSLGETPWVDRHLRSAWARIADHVPADWMPRTLDDKRGVEEYGCGHYGCVMPTNVEGLVCKLTTDISEARFVAAYFELGGKPAGLEGGIVEYEKIFALRDQKHRGRPLFVLWRSEAHSIGFLNAVLPSWGSPMRNLLNLGFDEYQMRPIREGERLLRDFLTYAGDARKIVRRRRGDREAMLTRIWKAYENAPRYSIPTDFHGFERIGANIQNCSGVAQEIANTDVVYPIGSALDHYLDEGLLLADVHAMNVGLDENRMPVITDPGHVVAIHPRWTHWPKIPII